MAQTIKIKRSSSAAAPSSALGAGELAYSFNSDKLFIGPMSGATNSIIGGKTYVDMLDHTAGTLTASSAIIVDSSSKIDQLKTANLTIGANSITSASGDVDIVAAANLDLDLTGGQIDVSTQATEIGIVDNSATSFVITEGSNAYMTFITTNSAEKIRTHKTFIVDGDGTTTNGGVSISNGLIDLKNGGSVSKIKFYCESANAHAQTLQGAAHSLSATNTLTLPHVGTILATTDGAQTFTNKTLTSPDINGGTIDGATIGGSSAGAGTFSSLTATTADINGGNIDGTTIGASSAAAITGTTITGTTVTDGTASISSGAISGVTQLDVDNIRTNGNTISTTDSNGNLTLAPNGTGTVVVPSGYKDRAGFGATSLVSKEYVDAVKTGLDFKDSVVVASTANVSISSAPAAIDGVTLTSADRVLLKDQSTGSQNGIYIFNGSGSAMTRATDFDSSTEVTSGAFFFVEQGTVNGDNGFVLTTDGSITVGTTSLSFVQFSGAGQIVAGDGMSKSGNTLNVNDDNQTLEISGDNLRIKGITQTATGDLIFGNTNGANTGYERLAIGSYDSTNSVGQILQVGANSTVTWSNTIDGGKFS